MAVNYVLASLSKGFECFDPTLKDRSDPAIVLHFSLLQTNLN